MSQLLVLGQAGAYGSTLPFGGGATLLYLSDASYGHQSTSLLSFLIGEDLYQVRTVDSPLRVDTDDYPILGDAGRTLLRRLYVKVAWSLGEVLVRVTPRIDFQTLLTPQSFTLPAQVARRVRVLDVPVARVCSYAGVKFEVVTRAGPLELLGLACAHRPLAQAADYVAGTP